MLREEDDAVISMRRYLMDVPVPKFRIAVTRLMASEHPLAVERLRYNERYRPHVPRQWRLCRLCVRKNGIDGADIEDECHALWECTSEERLTLRRDTFLDEAFGIWPSLRHIYTSSTPGVWTQTLLENTQLLCCFPKFVFDVFDIFQSVEMWVPPPYLYSPV